MSNSAIINLNRNFSCNGRKVSDSDNDSILIDDILRQQNISDEGKLLCAAKYLAKLGNLENVSAAADPTNPDEMTWVIDGKNSFTLVKADGFLKYRETANEKDQFVLNTPNYGLLFGINPWFVKADIKSKADPLKIRTPEYWVERYNRVSKNPILSRNDILSFNERNSQAIPKVDYSLTEIPDRIPKNDLLDLILQAYSLGANVHIIGDIACNLGAAGNVYTGDLNNKQIKWTLVDWEEVAKATGLSIAAKTAKDAGCQGDGFYLDFKSAGENLSDEVDVRYGVITTQTNLRAVPSQKACYASPSPNEDDGCEYHRPHIEPVRILWKGNGWFFVKTEQEYGWVEEKDLAIATKDDVTRILSGTVVFNKFSFTHNGIQYGMGTRLPMVGTFDGDIIVDRPTRNEYGRLVWKSEAIPPENVEINPQYTYETVIKMLFAATGGVWLLANKPFNGIEGVDCSGLTKMAVEVAGLLLGRNSGSAQGLAGKELWTRPKDLVMEAQNIPDKQAETWDLNVKKTKESKEQIRAVLEQWHKDMLSGKSRGILLLGWNGHVGIFLGMDNRGRAIVISSASRLTKVEEKNDKEPYAAKTSSIWTLGPIVTPLEITETDPVTNTTIPTGKSRLSSWYGRISFIRELL